MYRRIHLNQINDDKTEGEGNALVYRAYTVFYYLMIVKTIEHTALNALIFLA